MFLQKYNTDKLDIFNNNLKSNFSIFYLYFETGFDFDDLKDNNGKLFIIHPDESNIIRLNSYLIIKHRLNENTNFRF